jgi:poly-gamma-glutamate synthesis protein (capsule biosynthesis protein)
MRKPALLALLSVLLLRPGYAGPVTLVFVGDVMLDDGPGATLAAGQDPLEHVAPLFAGADLVVANLECPVATTGVEVPKPWAFRAHPRAIEVVKRHFGAVSLANNHSGDFGDEALVETMALLGAAGVPFFGAGKDLASAHAPLILERKGTRVALIGCNEFKPRAFEAEASSPGVAWCDEDQVLRDVRVARAKGADLVIPFLHWGWEGEPAPTARQRELAHKLVDAGADAVIGGHPHVVQDPELYQGRLILYSLGNFVFDGFDTEAGRTGWALRMTLCPDGLRDWSTTVVRIDERGTPRPVAGVSAFR